MIDLPHDLGSEDYAGSTEGDRRQIAMNRTAIQFARAAAREYQMPAGALVNCGKINAAATEKGLLHNAAYAKHLDNLGESYRLLDAAAMGELTGVDYYRGGLWTPGAAMLQPALYIRGLAAGLQAHPEFSLYEDSPVTALERSTDGWRATTPGGVVRASKVILAVNGMLERFGYHRRRLMHVFTYASMTRALTDDECHRLGGSERHWAFTPADPMGTTVRRISGMGGDRIVVRNRFTYDPSMAVPGGRLSAVAVDHRRAFQQRFPMLDAVEMEYCWGGRLCLSLNGVSTVGRLDEGVYSACCQNGLGTARGTLLGILAAEQASGATESLVPEYRTEAVPRRLWPEPFMWLGANGYLRWKAWRAGREF